MRALILVAGAALAMTACGGKQEAANTANVDEQLAVENMAGNDVTAIDAATGEDANMAADVNFMINESVNLSGNGNASASAAKTRQSTLRPSTSNTSATDNSVANTTANSNSNNVL